GAGWVVAQPELRPDTFALYLENILADPAALNGAAQCAGKFGRPDAAHDLAQLAMELAFGSRPQGRAA
ncbi:MAG: UDP-N-acetylglucosamine--N-acetylmuramyl-(pentapeptide) pyrophosphoryl-undecaprenol N-acetylglucosamine transferase, partial [Alphaproteobacteria bacterium]|nr:UDP-N-acetylglucosamine--N-acetylmuramyl-(pentapeptide) pyrophosphoryl-undecaprenol N-acetylglucosamine transferase [Alphaproteobacteria bacterium]